MRQAAHVIPLLIEVRCLTYIQFLSLIHAQDPGSARLAKVGIRSLVDRPRAGLLSSGRIRRFGCAVAWGSIVCED